MKDKILFTTMLMAPTAAQMMQATEHLRYWPYVKAYRKVDEKRVLLTLNMGHVNSLKERKRLDRLTRKLIALCLRQHCVRVLPLWRLAITSDLCYSDELFLRPDSKLRPVSDYIKPIKYKSNFICL